MEGKLILIIINTKSPLAFVVITKAFRISLSQSQQCDDQWNKINEKKMFHVFLEHPFVMCMPCGVSGQAGRVFPLGAKARLS